MTQHNHRSGALRILIFGGTGKLGSEILSQRPHNLEMIAPTRSECDITKLSDVRTVFKRVQPNIVINVAALVGAKECEDNKSLAWSTNVIGAANIAKVCAEANIRLVFTSSAAIFDGEKGRYTETEPPTPTYYYAITKVAAEQAVSMVPNHAIIRLDFFPLTKLKYSKVFSDHYTSKLPITEAAAKTIQIALSDFTGTIHIGQERDTLYNILKPYHPEIQPIKIKDSPLPDFPTDISLDLALWKKTFKQNA